MDPALTEEEERFMRWLEEDDVTGHHLGEAAGVPPHWQSLRNDAARIGDLLRDNVASAQEPSDTESFNEEVRRRLS